jgi:hypothetical protein
MNAWKHGGYSRETQELIRLLKAYDKAMLNMTL